MKKSFFTIATLFVTVNSFFSNFYLRLYQITELILANTLSKTLKLNMKNIITLFVLMVTLISAPLYSQEKVNRQETIAKFKISDGTVNGSDITPYLLEQNAYLVIYRDETTKTIHLANFWEKANSQSYGPIYEIEKKHIDADSENYETDLFFFQWGYINTYDNKKGTANVQLLKVYNPQGVYFKITIIPENLDVLVYKGYMDGIVDLSVYQQK